MGWFAVAAVIALGLATPAQAQQAPLAEIKDANDVTVFQVNYDGALLGLGTLGTGAIPTSGAGDRLMWYPGKAAFRVGGITGGQWDDANIGNYSAAMGKNTTASGESSVAMGNNTRASESQAIAMGFNTEATGRSSTAMGGSTTASGEVSTAMGAGSTAQSYASLAIGQYNTVAGDKFQWVATDPLFVAGNGTPFSPSNALTLLKNGDLSIAGTLTTPGFTLLKNGDLSITGTLTAPGFTLPTGATDGYVLTTDASGNASWQALAEADDGDWTIDGDNLTAAVGGNVGIGTTTPGARLDVSGSVRATGFTLPTGATNGYVLTTDASGNASWQAPAGGGNGDDGDWTIDGDKLTTTRGLLSTGTLGAIPATGPGTRLMWYPAKAAFRAGQAFNTEWNDANIGFASTAMGYGARASGKGSTAMSRFATAGDDYSTAIGRQTQAYGVSSTAIGYNTRAIGTYSTAMGQRTEAQAYASFVIGRNNVGQGSATSWVATDPLFVVGNGSGSASSNALTLLKNGHLGLGDISPEAKLVVKRNVSGSGGAANPENFVAIMDNPNTSGGDVLYLRTGESTPDGGANFITFVGGNESVGAVEGNNSGGVEYKSGGADFAEMLPRLDVSEVIDAGKIVGVTSGKVTQQTAGAERLMVVSDQAAFVGNMQPTEEQEALFEQVAFIGQVPTWVEGRVNVGDWIVASGRGDGIGRAVAPEAWDPAADGPIVGQAWEAQAGGTGRVNTAIGLDHTKPLIDRLARQQAEIESLRQRLEQLDAIEARLQHLEARTN